MPDDIYLSYPVLTDFTKIQLGLTNPDMSMMQKYHTLALAYDIRMNNPHTCMLYKKPSLVSRIRNRLGLLPKCWLPLKKQEMAQNWARDVDGKSESALNTVYNILKDYIKPVYIQ